MTIDAQMLAALESVLREVRHGRFYQIDVVHEVQRAVDAAGGRRLDLTHHCVRCQCELTEDEIFQKMCVFCFGENNESAG
jgi:hypothetical protein